MSGLKRDPKTNEWEGSEFPKAGTNEIIPMDDINNVQLFLAFFYSSLVVKFQSKELATFDVYSMNKYKWYRFGNIVLFRHSIWVYYSILSQ